MKKLAIIMSLVLALFLCSCTENSDNTSYNGILESSDKEIEPDENYDYGTLHYKNGNYDEAKKCFSVITSKDPNYEKAQEMIEKCDEKICESYIEKAEEYLKNDEIDRAINEIELGLEKYPNFEALMIKSEEYEIKKKESIVSKAEAFETKEDYTNALIVYQQILELYPEDNQTKAKLKELKEKILMQIDDCSENEEYGNVLMNYRVLLEAFPDDSALKSSYDKSYESIIQKILEKSEEKNEKDGYQSAIQYLKTMSSSVSDDRINEKIDYYYGFEPVYLTDLEPYSGEAGCNYELNDKLKNNYSYSLIGLNEDGGSSLYAPETNLDDSIVLRYYLNKHYKTFSGTFAVPYDYRNDDGSVRAEIYSDNVKVFSTDTYSSSSDPQSFSINVEGVDFIEIKWTYVDYSSDAIGWTQAHANLATLFDARLTKN